MGVGGGFWAFLEPTTSGVHGQYQSDRNLSIVLEANAMDIVILEFLLFTTHSFMTSIFLP